MFFRATVKLLSKRGVTNVTVSTQETLKSLINRLSGAGAPLYWQKRPSELHSFYPIRSNLASLFKPRFFQVKVTFDSVHHLVVDPALVAQPHQLLAFCPEHLSLKPLEGTRALFVVLASAILIDDPEACRKAPPPVIVEAAHPLCRVLAHPLLERQLVDPCCGGLGYLKSCFRLLLFPAPVIFDLERTDERGKAQALQDKRC